MPTEGKTKVDSKRKVNILIASTDLKIELGSPKSIITFSFSLGWLIIDLSACLKIFKSTKLFINKKDSFKIRC